MRSFTEVLSGNGRNLQGADLDVAGIPYIRRRHLAGSIRACAVAQAPMFATLGTRLEGGFSSTVQVRGLSASVSLAR
jgi:hypothetical protein